MTVMIVLSSIVGVVVSYGVIRLGVRHGMQDALREDLQSNPGTTSANPYGKTRRGPSGEQL